MLCPLLLITIALPFALLWSQQCPQAPVLTPSKEVNLFTEEQESQLGDIFAEQLAYSIHVIEDPEVAAYLEKVGQRLLQQMPSSKFKFRFYVVDSPDANAFAIAGGRVFVTRKLIATVKSEDELAGVLAHELGHQLAHHSALDWSRVFREVLKLEKVGDRADIESRYNEVLDTYRTKEGAIQAALKPGEEQTGADQVGVYALARAGYQPQAIIDFWDRFAETKGKKGSWLSDFFGTGWPESKRLRELVKNLETIPGRCREGGQQPVAEDFLRWQAAVKSYAGFGKKEALHNVVSKRSLSPILRGDIEEFRFSPDGKYLLAQDGASIFVMTREPLQMMFTIRAPEAAKAQFSPDSKLVVFYNESLRVERWNVAERRMQDVFEPYVFRGCVQTALSPDGAFLACMRPNRETYFPLDLQLYDVINGTTLLTKKGLVGPQSVGYNTLINYVMVQVGKRPVINMAYSPDGKYFVAARDNAHVLVDLTAKSEVPMSKGVQKYTTHSFAFVGPDRIVGAENVYNETAAIVKFPSGETTVDDIPLGGRTLFPASKGDYAIVRPLAKAPVGILDLKAKKLVIGSKTDAIDIYDGQFVNERVNAELGLYNTAGQPPVAALQLPRSPLAGIEAAVASGDLTRVALSETARGAVWDLNSGDRLLYIRGFRGAGFDENGVSLLFAPVDQYEPPLLKGEKENDAYKRHMDQPGHKIGRVDLATKAITEVEQMKMRTSVRQFGHVVLAMTPKDDENPRKDVRMEARDARTGATLWARSFPNGSPDIHGSAADDYIVFAWYLGTGGAKEELRDDPEARKMVGALKETEGAYLVEVLDPQTGGAKAKFPIATGKASFRARRMRASGDTLLMTDNNRRVMLFSFKGGNKGRLFGGYAVLSKDGSKLAIEREPGRLLVYDGATLKELEQFTFGTEIIAAQFDAPAKRLLVLTDDETAVVLDVTKSAFAAGRGTD